MTLRPARDARGEESSAHRRHVQRPLPIKLPAHGGSGVVLPALPRLARIGDRQAISTG